jgi:cell division septation protein DedD
MASDGNIVGGRALIDSVVKATSPTSPVYPQALYLRATLATNAADAESDYRHIVVDYPLAPQAEDALLRLAQLELARGDRDDALAHLQRIPRDYPRSKSIARASYWTARVLFEKNDIAAACAANVNALAQAAPGEVELRNQIEYQSQRCTSHAQTSASSTPAVTTPTATTEKPAPATRTEPAPTVVAPVETAQPIIVAAPPEKAPPEKAPTPAPVEAKKAATSPARAWSVQVAAYNRKAQADQLASTLGKRGYSARVDGTTAPFRVRIGRYASAKDAESALREIKSKKMTGFVVRAP